MTDEGWGLVHFASCAFMAGVIWFVQIVHYPLMRHVTDRWSEFEIAHQNRTTFVVAPVMFLEALSTMMLWIERPGDTLRIASVVTLSAVVLSTFAVQVPIHAALSRGFQENLHRRLVRTNFIRALLWTTRSIIGVLILQSTGSSSGLA